VKLDWAILSNSSEAKDGLASILSAGWDTAYRPSFPAPFLGAVTVRVLFHRSEAALESGTPHRFEMLFWTADGQSFAPGISFTMHVKSAPSSPTGWDVPAVFAANLSTLAVPKAGEYSIEILVDGEHLKSLHFRFMEGGPPGSPTA
jgi:uncharacterized protein DUF6941